MFTYNTSPGKKLFQRVTFQPNQFYGGTRRSFSYGLGARATSQLSAELNYNRNDVKMPWGNFLVNLTSLRVDGPFGLNLPCAHVMSTLSRSARGLAARILEQHGV